MAEEMSHSFGRKVLAKMGAPPKNFAVPTLDYEMVGKLHVFWLYVSCCKIRSHVRRLPCLGGSEEAIFMSCMMQKKAPLVSD